MKYDCYFSFVAKNTAYLHGHWFMTGKGFLGLTRTSFGVLLLQIDISQNEADMVGFCDCEQACVKTDHARPIWLFHPSRSRLVHMPMLPRKGGCGLVFFLGGEKGREDGLV